MSSVPRFFVPPESIVGETAILPPDAAHHAVSVLRLRVGEAVILHDGLGNACAATLTAISGKSATVRITDRYALNTEPTTRITVAQALPKTSEKIEQVLQHGTEVGAAGFVFFTGARSVARLADGEKIDKRLTRWKGIVQGAAEQSGRGVLPPVTWLPFARDVAATVANYDAAFLLHEAATHPLRDAITALPSDAIRLLILVGPEGGFTDEEVSLFTTAEPTGTKKARAISLGPRVLRTETAALVALAQILFVG